MNRSTTLRAIAVLMALGAHTLHAQSRVGADSATRLTRFGRDIAYGTLEGLAFAGLDQLRDEPVEWQRGWRGYGQRVASNLGEFYIQEGVTDGLAALMNHPLDYPHSPNRGTTDRISWALRAALFDRMPKGKQELAIPRIVGAYVGSFAQGSWRPADGHRTRSALVNGTTSLAIGAAINLYHEFSPWSSANRCRRGGAGCRRGR